MLHQMQQLAQVSAKPMRNPAFRATFPAQSSFIKYNAATCAGFYLLLWWNTKQDLCLLFALVEHQASFTALPFAVALCFALGNGCETTSARLQIHGDGLSALPSCRESHWADVADVVWVLPMARVRQRSKRNECGEAAAFAFVSGFSPLRLNK